MDLIRPQILNDSTVEAIFTTAGRNNDKPEQGLDFGKTELLKNSSVKKNYNTLFELLGWSGADLALASQVHGNQIQIVHKPGIYENVDGLITRESGLTLGIRVADCAAVLIADPKEKLIGAFHAGWRGAASNILPRGIKMMEKEGGIAERMSTYISPCISLKNFEVGEEVADQFPDPFVDRASYKKPHVDLKKFLEHQMMESGITSDSIEISEYCTLENSRFYSYRREREAAGRMLAMIKLNR